jgi:hypothetical protein
MDYERTGILDCDANFELTLPISASSTPLAPGRRCT